jgi:hypothetical protein
MKKYLSISLLSAAVAVSSYAAVLADWDLNSLGSSSTSAVVSSTDADIAASDLTGGEAAGWPNALVAFPSNSAAGDLAGAIVLDDYFSFTLTPSAGTVSYDNIFSRITLGANVRPATGAFSLLSSATGFTDADELGSFDLTLVGAATNGTSSHTYDLSGVTELQTIAGAVEFRIYYYSTGANQTQRMGLGRIFNTTPESDLTINGSVAVPEPSAYAGLAGLVALGSVMLRRRRA